MKKKAGICYVCGKPVYILSGKSLPDHYKGFASAVCDFVGRREVGHPKRHHYCEQPEEIK